MHVVSTTHTVHTSSKSSPGTCTTLLIVYPDNGFVMSNVGGLGAMLADWCRVEAPHDKTDGLRLRVEGISVAV
jgi:hypothetical protein